MLLVRCLGFLLKEKNVSNLVNGYQFISKSLKMENLSLPAKLFRSKPELVMNENDILPALNKS